MIAPRLRPLGHWLLWVMATLLLLQVALVLRIAVMAWVDPASTAFERSEAWRLSQAPGSLRWSQQWVPADQISRHLMRAVIAAEDAGFMEHGGVEWEAIQSAWEKNAKRMAQAERRAAQNPRKAVRPAKLVGGSTITQQLAKNLLLSGERHLLRKAQELLLALSLEALLSKERILEIYLNHVEWGEGVFGAEAAARHYFQRSARQLTAAQAARLAVMLPSPKYFDRHPASAYLNSRSATIMGRMSAVSIP